MPAEIKALKHELIPLKLDKRQPNRNVGLSRINTALYGLAYTIETTRKTRKGIKETYWIIKKIDKTINVDDVTVNVDNMTEIVDSRTISVDTTKNNFVSSYDPSDFFRIRKTIEVAKETNISVEMLDNIINELVENDYSLDMTQFVEIEGSHRISNEGYLLLINELKKRKLI